MVVNTLLFKNPFEKEATLVNLFELIKTQNKKLLIKFLNQHYEYFDIYTFKQFVTKAYSYGLTKIEIEDFKKWFITDTLNKKWYFPLLQQLEAWICSSAYIEWTDQWKRAAVKHRVALVEKHLAGLQCDIVCFALMVIDLQWPWLLHVLSYLDYCRYYLRNAVHIYDNHRSHKTMLLEVDYQY